MPARTSIRLHGLTALVSFSFFAACAPELDAQEQETHLAIHAAAISASYPAGFSLKTTTELNLRSGPGTSASVVTKIPAGTVVKTAAAGGAVDGFYLVTQGGFTGYAYGAYLLSTAGVFKYGLHPDASDALKQAGYTSALLYQTIGSAAASQGTHAQDGTANGHPYSAATDLRTSHLTETQLRALLEELGLLGFAAWYRKDGFDGWSGTDHIHAIYVGAPMKSSLRAQVNDWLVGKNGLVSHADYKFYDWSPAALLTVKRLVGLAGAPGGFDSDQDGLLDGQDNCKAIPNKDQADLDKDGKGDACDTNRDGDSILDPQDNCPDLPNKDQTNLDMDTLGNACDPDRDGDGVPDAQDNCPQAANKDQLDSDANKKGDACEGDDDSDGVPDATDNCKGVANVGQADSDGDQLGDACDPDDDGDGVVDASDNCPLDGNATQSDLDSDATGDACDTDLDGDGVTNDDDNCPELANPGQESSTEDGSGDVCAPAPGTPQSPAETCEAEPCPEAKPVPLVSSAGCSATSGVTPGLALLLLAGVLLSRRRRAPLWRYFR